MKNCTILLLLILCNIMGIGSTQAQEWKILDDVPMASRYDDIYFLDENRGWAINNSGLIFRTVDGGEQWELLYNTLASNRSIEFINDSIGFVGTVNKFFFRTTDAGATWQEISQQISVQMQGICGLSHVGDHVYGVGVYSNPAYFIKSQDRGETWTFKDMSELADGLVEVYFLDEQVGFASGIKEGEGGVILKTEDGGDNWIQVHLTNNALEYVWKLDFVNELVAYGSIETFMEPYTGIVKTVDGGNTWETIQVLDKNVDIQGIGFLDETHGWIGPRLEPMYETFDGGMTWEQTGIMSNINRFFRIHSQLMYASGTYVYKYGESSSTASQDEQIVSKIHKMKVYPNPVSNQFVVELEIKESGFVRFEIFTENGQKVHCFMEEFASPDEYRWELDSELLQLTAGPYFLVLRTRQEFQTLKFIKQ